MAKALDPRDVTVRRNLVRFREAADLTQAQAAELSGISIDNLRRYESGKTETVPHKVIAALAPIYGHPTDHFSMETPPEANIADTPDFLLRPNPAKDDIDEKLFRELQAKVEEYNRQAKRKRDKSAR